MSQTPAPRVPAFEERGWRLVADEEATRFELPAMRVLAHTLIYEDHALRTRVEEATDVDQTWRFFFASRLGFEPPLPPFTGTASMYGSVRSEARSAFVRDLERRGIRDVERGRAERTRTETGDRLSLTRYRGVLPVAGTNVPIAGALGVWTHDGSFRLAGGGYPDGSLANSLDNGPETNPNEFRDELVDAIREVR